MCRGIFATMTGQGATASGELEKTMEFFRLVRIVLWSFFGVRKSAAHEADFAHVKFSMLPVVAVGLAALIAGVILGVVLLVAHSTGTVQGF
jgi:hypothetical protein